MTKLTEWLAGLVIFLGIWVSALNLQGHYNFSPDLMIHVWMLPAYIIVAAGFGCVSILAYRVYTFNDCEEAAEELKKEIQEARADLKKKGFTFQD